MEPFHKYMNEYKKQMKKGFIKEAYISIFIFSSFGI